MMKASHSGSRCDSSFFEGTEKKVELVIDPSLPSLRGRGDEYWERVVRVSGATIVSKIENEVSTA